jgi:hypothetical protein
MGTHGKQSTYRKNGCRCEPCVEAYRKACRRHSRAHRERHGYSRVPPEGVTYRQARELLAGLLNETFPLGLTEDCPARKAIRR